MAKESKSSWTKLEITKNSLPNFIYPFFSLKVIENTKTMHMQIEIMWDYDKLSYSSSSSIII